MAYTQYYYQPADTALSATEILRRTGVNVATYDSAGLAAFGIYPITLVTQPFNTDLYTVAKTYTVNGANADETYAATNVTLATAKAAGITQMIQQAHGQTVELIKASDIGFRLFVTLSSMLVGDRPAKFAPWLVRRQATVNRLATNITAVNAATTNNAINAIVSPAWGSINIAYDSANPNNLLASDFTTNKFFSKTLTSAAFELHFPQTNKTVTYSSGFAATSAAFTDDDKTVQIRRTSNSLVVDEFCVPGAAAVVEVPFGYRQYLGVDVSPTSNLLHY